MPWAAAGAIGGALIASSASGEAADQQSESSQAAILAQQQAQAQLRQDLSPWTEAGGAAQSRLNQYMGIGGVGSSGVTSMGLSTGLSPDQVRQQLLGRFTTTGGAGGAGGAQVYTPSSPADAFNYLTDGRNVANALAQQSQAGHWENQDNASPGERRWVPDTTPQAGGTSTIDEEGLNAAIAKYYEEQNAQNASLQNDPKYGSLLRAYRDGAEFDSGPAFSFTGENLASDPGYKFGLDQGTQGIERGQASRGNFLSGAAMKELTRFNEDYAGTKFNDAFSRNLNSYTTNLNRRQNEWNTNLNAYDRNRNSIYDFLTGVSRTGQNSAAQVGTSNNRAAESAGGYITDAGSAQSAATIAGGNALQGAINTGVNTFNSGNSLNSAAGWNSMISSGATPYGASSTSVGGGSWTPSTNYFASGNGRLA